MNKLKLSKNTTEASIQGNMSMTSMRGKAIYSMSRPKMRKLENN